MVNNFNTDYYSPEIKPGDDIKINPGDIFVFNKTGYYAIISVNQLKTCKMVCIFSDNTRVIGKLSDYHQSSFFNGLWSKKWK